MKELEVLGASLSLCCGLRGKGGLKLGLLIEGGVADDVGVDMLAGRLVCWGSILFSSANNLPSELSSSDSDRKSSGWVSRRDLRVFRLGYRRGGLGEDDRSITSCWDAEEI